MTNIKKKQIEKPHECKKASSLHDYMHHIYCPHESSLLPASAVFSLSCHTRESNNGSETAIGIASSLSTNSLLFYIRDCLTALLFFSF